MPTVPPPSRDPTLDVGVFWLRYKSELIGALLVVLLAAVGFAGYRIYKDRRATAAAALLAGAKTIPEYRQVIQRYPGTPSSASAHLLLAEAQRNAKKFTEANATLQIFIDMFPGHQLVSTAYMGRAANFESMGKLDEALSTLQRVITNYPKSFNAPLALLAQVHLLKAKGKTEEARRVCENFLAQYRDSYLAGEASRQLRMLRPKSEPPVSSAPAGVPKVSVSPRTALPSNPAPTQPKKP